MQYNHHKRKLAQKVIAVVLINAFLCVDMLYAGNDAITSPKPSYLSPSLKINNDILKQDISIVFQAINLYCQGGQHSPLFMPVKDKPYFVCVAQPGDALDANLIDKDNSFRVGPYLVALVPIEKVRKNDPRWQARLPLKLKERIFSYWRAILSKLKGVGGIFLERKDSSENEPESDEPGHAESRDLTIEAGQDLAYHPRSWTTYTAAEVLDDLNLGKKDVFLDIGCGFGVHTLVAGQRAKQAIGIDISEENIGLARKIAQYSHIPEVSAKLSQKNENFPVLIAKLEEQHVPKAIPPANVEFKVNDAKDIPLQTDSVDKTACLDVLSPSHPQKNKRILQEIFRVTKTNGLICVNMPSIGVFAKNVKAQAWSRLVESEAKKQGIALSKIKALENGAIVYKIANKNLPRDDGKVAERYVKRNVIVSVEVTDKNMNVACVDAESGLLKKPETFPLDTGLTPDEFMDNLAGIIIKNITAQPGIRFADVRGISLSLTGTIEPEAGIAISLPALPFLNNISFKEKLSEIINAKLAAEKLFRPIEVYIQNHTVNEAAAEARLGAAKEVDSFTFIHLDSHLGSIMMRDGLPFFGLWGDEHVLLEKVHQDAGSAEVVSTTSIVKKAKILLRTDRASLMVNPAGQSELNIENIAAAFKQGDRLATTLIEEAAAAVAKEIKMWILNYNEKVFVIGGRLTELLGERFIQLVRKKTAEELKGYAALVGGFDTSKIIAAELGDRAVFLGGVDTVVNAQQEIYHIQEGTNEYFPKGKTQNYLVRSLKASAHLVIEHDKFSVKTLFPNGNAGCVMDIMTKTNQQLNLRRISQRSGPFRAGTQNKYYTALKSPAEDAVETFYQPGTGHNGLVFDLGLGDSEAELTFKQGTVRYIRDLESGNSGHREMWIKKLIDKMKNLPPQTKAAFSERGFSFNDFINWSDLKMEVITAERKLETLDFEQEKTATKLIVTKKTFDGKNEERTEIIFPEGVRVKRAGMDRVMLVSSSEINAKVKMSTNVKPLVPLMAEEILNERGLDHRQLLKEKAMAPGARREDVIKHLQFEHALRCLEFLFYRDKIVAGSWRFLTYFGRDIIISLILLKPYIRTELYELAMQNIFDRMSPLGDVAHEEHIGSQAMFMREVKLEKILEKEHLSPADIDAAVELLQTLGDPIYDYKMIDDDFIFAYMNRVYLRDENVPAAWKKEFLDRMTPAGLSNLEMLLRNLNLILRRIQPFVDNPVVTNLIDQEKTSTGHGTNWRDSGFGNAGGTFHYDVNTVWAPRAIKYAEEILSDLQAIYGRPHILKLTQKISRDTKELLKKEGITRPPDLLQKYLNQKQKFEKARTAWQESGEYFKTELSIVEIQQRLKDWLEHLPTDTEDQRQLKTYWLNVTIQGISIREMVYEEKCPEILKAGITFPALSLYSDGTSTEVMHSDIMFRLLQDDLSREEVTNIIKLLLLPFPVGLRVENVGFVVSNPALSRQNLDIWDKFMQDDYHGPLVAWPWQWGGAEAGLKRQMIGAVRGKTLLHEEDSAYMEILSSALDILRADIAKIGPELSGAEVLSYYIDNEGRPKAMLYKKGNIAQLWTIILEFVEEFDMPKMEVLANYFGAGKLNYGDFLEQLTAFEVNIASLDREEKPIKDTPEKLDMAIVDFNAWQKERLEPAPEQVLAKLVELYRFYELKGLSSWTRLYAAALKPQAAVYAAIMKLISEEEQPDWHSQPRGLLKRKLRQLADDYDLSAKDRAILAEAADINFAVHKLFQPALNQSAEKALIDVVAEKDIDGFAIICADVGASRITLAGLKVSKEGEISEEVLDELNIDTHTVIGDKDTFYNNLAREIRLMQQKLALAYPRLRILPLVSVGQLGKFVAEGPMKGALVTDIGLWKIGPGFIDIVPEEELKKRLGGVVVVNNDALAQFLYSVNRILSIPGQTRLIPGEKIGYLDLGTSLGGGFIRPLPTDKVALKDTITDGHISDIVMNEVAGNINFDFPADGVKYKASIPLWRENKDGVWATDLVSRNAVRIFAQAMDQTMISQGKAPLFLPLLPGYAELSLSQKQAILAPDNLATALNAEFLIKIMEMNATGEAAQRAQQAAAWLFGFIGENLGKVILKIYQGDIQKGRTATAWGKEDITAVAGTTTYIIGGELGYRRSTTDIIRQAAAEYLRQQLPAVDFQLIPVEDDPLIGAKGAGLFVEKAQLAEAAEKTNGIKNGITPILGYVYPPRLIKLSQEVIGQYNELGGLADIHGDKAKEIELLWEIFKERLDAIIEAENMPEHIISAAWLQILMRTAFAEHSYARNALMAMVLDLEQTPYLELTKEYVMAVTKQYRAYGQETYIWQAVENKMDHRSKHPWQHIQDSIARIKKGGKAIQSLVKILKYGFVITSAILLTIGGINIQEFIPNAEIIHQLGVYINQILSFMRQALIIYGTLTIGGAVIASLDRLSKGYMTFAAHLLKKEYGGDIVDGERFEQAIQDIHFVGIREMFKLLKGNLSNWRLIWRLTTLRHIKDTLEGNKKEETVISVFNIFAFLGHMRDTLHELLIRAAYQPAGRHDGLRGVERREHGGNTKYVWLMNALTDRLGRELFIRNRVLKLFNQIVFASTLDPSYSFWQLQAITDDLLFGLEKKFGPDAAWAIILDAYFNGHLEKGSSGRQATSFVEAVEIAFGEGTFVKLDQMLEKGQHRQARAMLQSAVYSREIANIYDKLAALLKAEVYDKNMAMEYLNNLDDIVQYNNQALFNPDIAGYLYAVLNKLSLLNGLSAVKEKVQAIKYHNNKFITGEINPQQIKNKRIIALAAYTAIFIGGFILATYLTANAVIGVFAAIGIFGIIFKLGREILKLAKGLAHFIGKGFISGLEAVSKRFGPLVGRLLDRVAKAGADFRFNTDKVISFEQRVKIKGRLPRSLNLQRVLAEGAVEELLVKDELGAVLGAALKAGKECYARQVSMSGKPTFIAIIGNKENIALFKENVREIILSAQVLDWTLKDNVVIDLSRTRPAVYVGNDAQPDDRLAGIITGLMLKAAANLAAKEKEKTNWRQNYLLAKEKIKDFSTLVGEGEVVFAGEVKGSGQYIAVVGHRQGEELVEYLIREKSRVLAQLNGVVIDLRGDKIVIHHQLSAGQEAAAKKAARELKKYITGFMKYYLISDLHLGDMSDAEDFGPLKARHLAAKLERAIQDRATLIINGDFMELWQARFGHIKRRYGNLFRKLQEVRKIVYIVGNHDEAVMQSPELFQAVQELLPNAEIVDNWIDEDLGIILEHGNNADNFNRHSLIGRGITAVVGKLERWVDPRIDDILGETLLRFVPASKAIEAEVTNYLARQFALVEMYRYYSQGEDRQRKLIVSFGHTHEAIHPFNGPHNQLIAAMYEAWTKTSAFKAGETLLDFWHYVNSGTWSGTRRRFQQNRQAWKKNEHKDISEILLHPKFQGEEKKMKEHLREDTVIIKNPERNMVFYNGEIDVVDLTEKEREAFGQEALIDTRLGLKETVVSTAGYQLVEQGV